MNVILSMLSGLLFLGFIATSAQTAPQVQWGPEQWAFLSAAIITSIGSAVAAIIAARRTGAVHRSLKLPSNSISAGELLEAMGHVQHVQANLMVQRLLGDEHVDIPSANQIAQELRKLKDEENGK